MSELNWDRDHTFIQWKGTDVCMDWKCISCNTVHHIDGYGIYTVQCPKCNTVFNVGQNVILTPTHPNAVRLMTERVERCND